MRSGSADHQSRGTMVFNIGWRRAIRRVTRAMIDASNFTSVLLMANCLKAWAYAKVGMQSASREVVLELRPLRLCVDVSRLEIISFWEIWHEGCYDAISVDHPRCVVDVGANIGVFSLYQSMVKRAEKVIAFEPSPEIFPRLVKNMEINGIKNVRVINAAVGDESAMLSFAESRISANSRVSETGSLKVPCVRLDDELRDVPGIDVLKIDTEGYETHVLRGACETLKKTDRIVLELHYPNEQKEIEAILFPIGFSLAKADGILVFYRRANLSSAS
jgi:FkbM family methyltransferase